MSAEMFINVRTVFDSKSIQVPITPSTSAEDVCIILCKQLGIGTVARHIFALREHNKSVFLSAIGTFEARNNTYDLRIRFKVAHTAYLKKVDLKAYDYFFHQTKNDVLENKIPDLVLEKHKKELVGLGISDMYRVMLEKDVPREVVESDYKKYIPKEVLKRHHFFLKKPIHDTLGKIEKGKHDVWFVKGEYLKQLESIAPEYLAEEYKAMTEHGGSVLNITVRVTTYHPTEPGIKYCLESKREKWYTICTIEELGFISIRTDSTAEICRKNGIPFYIKFNSLPHMYSFVSLLDGYYRLSVKWTFNLCKDVPTPSLQRLYMMKCHGPVGGVFSYSKLEEKRANRPGTFIIRESELKYNILFLDVCMKDSLKPKTYKIERLSEEEFIFNDDLTRYQNLSQLMASYNDPKGSIYLAECLPPSEYDKSPLLLCKPCKNTGDILSDAQEDITIPRNPVCIDVKDIQIYKDAKCLKWDKNRKKVKHRDGFKSVDKFDKYKFPENERSKAKKFCRNPDGDLAGPWCFVDSDEYVEKQYCDIPFCDDQDCMVFTKNVSIYSHYTSFPMIVENLTFAIKIWDPDSYLDSYAKLALTVLPLPLNGEEIEKLGIGIEIYLSNKRSALTFGNKDKPEYEESNGILKSNAYTFLHLTWDHNFLTLYEGDKTKPIFLHEYKSPKNTLLGFKRSKFTHYSAQGTNVLWSFPFCDDEEDFCDVHVTGTSQNQQFWTLRTAEIGHDLQMYVRAFHSASILLVPSPVLNFPFVKVHLYDKEGRTKILYTPYENGPTETLNENVFTELISFWKWTTLSLNLFSNTLQLYLTRDVGTFMLMEVQHEVVRGLRWFSPSSSNAQAHWSFYCKPPLKATPGAAYLPDCALTPQEISYVGKQSVTSEGLPCLPWSGKKFIPDGIQKEFKTDVLKEANYCRDPKNEQKGTYCYALSETGDRATKTHCQIRKCKSAECRMAGTGNDYIGRVNRTRSNRTCQYWLAHVPVSIVQKVYDMKKTRDPEENVTLDMLNPLFNMTIAQAVASQKSDSFNVTDISKENLESTTENLCTGGIVNVTKIDLSNRNENLTVELVTEISDTSLMANKNVSKAENVTNSISESPSSNQHTQNEFTNVSSESKPKIELANVSSETKPKIELANVSSETKPKIELVNVSSEIKPKIELANDSFEIKSKIELSNVSSEIKPKFELANVSSEIKQKIELTNVSSEIKPKIELTNVTSYESASSNGLKTTLEQFIGKNSTDLVSPSECNSLGKVSNFSELIPKIDLNSLRDKFIVNISNILPSDLNKDVMNISSDECESFKEKIPLRGAKPSEKQFDVYEKALVDEKIVNADSENALSKIINQTTSAPLVSTTKSQDECDDKDDDDEHVCELRKRRNWKRRFHKRKFHRPKRQFESIFPPTPPVPVHEDPFANAVHEITANLDESVLKKLEKIGENNNTSEDDKTYMDEISETIKAYMAEMLEKELTKVMVHPVDPKYLNDTLYPDILLVKAENFCRNPSRSLAGTWCYTMDKEVEMDVCHVPDCDRNEECTVFLKGVNPGQKHESSEGITVVYRCMWRHTQGKKIEVAMKFLKTEYKDRHLRSFLDLAGQWAFVQSNVIVRLFGITLTGQLSMVMEYVRLGSLEQYLQEKRAVIKVVDLIEASSNLASALWHLSENNIVHGNIRCRKLLVSCHDENSFTVKLADPGIHADYGAKEIHWVPIECYSNLDNARKSSAADVWAYATTVWEIFMYGEGFKQADHRDTMRSYVSGKRLPQPPICPNEIYKLLLECWNVDPYRRKQPQAVSRDINQLLYQVYNSRKVHSYAKIKSFDTLSLDSVNSAKTESTNVTNQDDLVSVFDMAEGDGDMSGGSSLWSGSTFRNQWRPYDADNSDDTFSTNFSLLQNFNFSTATATTSLDDISSLQSVFELDDDCNVVLQGRIGQGFYGEVYRGTLERLGDREQRLVAVKKLKSSTVASCLQDFEREISIMKTLKHPNIVEILGVQQDPEISLVMEYVQHGSLQNYLKIYKESLTVKQLLKYALDIAKGMDYLGKKNIVHRDLAARNILVVDENHVKISDFGLAQVVGKNNYYILKTNRELPIKWYALESLRDGKFSPKSDVWSYGVTMCEMFSHGEEPNLPIERTDGQEPQILLEALESGTRFACPNNCPQSVYVRIVHPCWHQDTHKRPAFHQLCNEIEELLTQY